MKQKKEKMLQEMTVMMKVENGSQKEIECLYDAKVTLTKTCTELKQVKQKLAETETAYKQVKPLCDKAEHILMELLMKWISSETKRKVVLMLKYYRTNERLEMYHAMLKYVMTGQKTRFCRAVMQWHFRLFVDMVNEDRYTVPSNTLLKRLWKKVGLIEGID